MRKIKVLNVGPVEWFSPHFCFTDENIEASDYDSLRDSRNLAQVVNEFEPDVLFIFRGDLVRNQLYGLRNVLQIEFSSEIYPTDIFSNKNSEFIAMKKFIHCMSKLNIRSKVFHYDESRRFFLEAVGLNLNYNFLPVNISHFGTKKIKDIDLLFFGRASARRVEILNGLKECGLRFVWIENGLDWRELSQYIERSHAVINITAENIDNFEPRILLAATGGVNVITENSVGLKKFLEKYPEMRKRVMAIKLSSDNILKAYKKSRESTVYSDLDPIKFSSNFFLQSQFN